MRCLIIDDEFSSRSRLRRLLASEDDVEVIGEAEDGIGGLDEIANTKPDLIFLDIEMPRLNGLQMLKALPPESLPLVVFVTGYDEHALAAFEAQAVSFLLKPIDESKLAAALKRSRLILENSFKVADENERVAKVARQVPVPLNHVVGRKQGRFILLRPADIFYFSAESGLVKAYTANDHFQVEMTLNELEEALETQRFFRAHRSFLVNLGRVKEIEPYFRGTYMLIMGDGARSQVQVSERQAKLLRERIPGL